MIKEQEGVQQLVERGVDQYLKQFPKLFTNAEASKILRLSEVSLWRERKAGRLGFRRCAGKILYTEEDLNVYLDSMKMSPDPARSEAIAA
jgi:hypothetical protein